jgi:tRNA threonylcarbamoyl adenosine modification protein (Sua5/YciO/YrdC/YwlC family)
VSIEAAVAAVREGQVVGLPTDTVYGIGVDPLNAEAVGRLYELKGRPQGKPVGLLVASLNQAVAVGEIEGAARLLASQHWPGALTLVVRPKVILSSWVGDSQARSIGVRVPDHAVALGLLEIVGPMAVTSANLSGTPEAVDHREAEDVFGDSVRTYLPGSSSGGEASTVVDATGGALTVLRKGPVEL